MRPLALAASATGLLFAAACSFDASPTGPAAAHLEAGISPVMGLSGDGGSASDAAAQGGSETGPSLAPEAAVPAPSDGAVVTQEGGGAGAEAGAEAGVTAPAADSGLADGGREDASLPDVPVTSPVRPGDYPSDPYGELYIPVPGVAGPGGSERGYKLHVPPSFSATAASPVLFAFHGEGSTGATFAAYGAELIGLADDLGFVLVVPNGTQSPGGALGSWNGGACCGAAALASVDDVAFVRAVLAHVRTQLRVDFSRTYALGFSGGAFLAYRLACEAADVFSAVISAGGGIGTADLSAVAGLGNNAFAACAPTRAVSVFHVHGSEDAYVPFATMTRAVDFWAHANGCNDTPAPSNPALGSGASSCVSFSGCRDNTLITACTVPSGGHCWFGSANCGSGNAPHPAQNIGRNSDDFATTWAVATFLGQLRPRP